MRRKFNSDAKKRKTVSGSGNSNKLVPHCQAETLLNRVEKRTDSSDLAEYIKDNGIVAKSIQKVPNAVAR